MEKIFNNTPAVPADFKKSGLVIFVFIYIFLFQPLHAGEIKIPDPPNIPEINADMDHQVFKYKVKIFLQGIPDPYEGEIVLNSDVLIINNFKSIKVEDVRKIIVKSWGKSKNLNKYIFYPQEYEIILRDYTKVNFNGNFDTLNKIRILNKKNTYIYLYYYDYYKDGKWINSGLTGFQIKFSKPADGCAISIEVNQ